MQCRPLRGRGGFSAGVNVCKFKTVVIVVADEVMRVCSRRSQEAEHPQTHQDRCGYRSHKTSLDARLRRRQIHILDPGRDNRPRRKRAGVTLNQNVSLICNSSLRLLAFSEKIAFPEPAGWFACPNKGDVTLPMIGPGLL